MYCDLHTHSFYSDGTFAPAHLVAEAKRLGLAAVALTDHNTIAGLPEFLTEAAAQNVTAVAGVELSTVWQGQELHLLGLFLPECAFAETEALVKRFAALKEASNRALVQRLNQAGFALDFAAIQKRSPTGNINRAHVAAEMLDRGYVSSISQAIEGPLSLQAGHYIPPERLRLTDAIRFLRTIGAVPVLAHPLQELTAEQLRTLLPEAKTAGLLGMETLHSSYDEAAIETAKQIAAEFGLQESGGSDFHGTVKPAVQLAVGKGNLRIPAEFYEKLKPLSK